MEQPLVSICTLVYNHEPYLRECFDGFVMQKTNFAYEILVHDDASTDGSADIIREYTAKYPHLFKPIFQIENQYSRGGKILSTIQFPRAKGKYIALCEGDDYWTDPLKLQKQVDFLESHPDYVMCSHAWKIFYQSTNSFYINDEEKSKDGVTYNLATLISGGWLFQPLTVLFRTDKLNLHEFTLYSSTMDAILFFHLLKKGEGYMISEEMGVYRVHSGGVWSGVGCRTQLRNEVKARIGLYKIEKSYDAAFFLRNQFGKWVPRSWIFLETRLIIKTFRIILQQFGLISTLKLFLSWFFLNKRHK